MSRTKFNGGGQTHFLKLREGSIAYDVAGSGPTILAVHGLGDTRHSFRFIKPLLVSAGFRVVAVDVRGHGESSSSFDSYTAEDIAEDLVQLIEHLCGGDGNEGGSEAKGQRVSERCKDSDGDRLQNETFHEQEMNKKIVIMGCCLAAGASVIVKEQVPKRVVGLILIGPFVRGGTAGASCYQLCMTDLRMRRPWGRGFWRSFYQGLFVSFPPDHEEYLRFLDAVYEPYGKFSALQRTMMISHAPSASILATASNKVKGSGVVVVMGDKDSDWPDAVEEARWVGEATGAREVIIIENVGHYPHVERPHEVFFLILPHLQAMLGFEKYYSASGTVVPHRTF